MMLCVIVVIDNHFKTRIVASAIIEDETLDTFQWILTTIFEETGINPGVIFTDSDPSMISAIKEIHPNTNHLLCIFHIDLNLRKKLKSKLGIRFEEFRHKFYACRNSLCTELFESRWVQLIDQYPESAKYMTDTLYINKESWGIPWIRNQFTAGAQSTQRIESINKQIHDKVDRSTSLCDLVININDYVKSEEHFENFEISRNALPTVGLPMLHNRFFGQADDIISQSSVPELSLGRLKPNTSPLHGESITFFEIHSQTPLRGMTRSYHINIHDPIPNPRLSSHPRKNYPNQYPIHLSCICLYICLILTYLEYNKTKNKPKGSI
jgi:hypothetical protein